MSLFQPAYRLVVCKPSAEDPSEATPLTPDASAAHSDSFKLCTMQGVTGYQPYLGFPEGRKGRYNPLNGRLDIGSLTFKLLDMRTGSGNLSRWVTAFLSVLKIGLRVTVEESLDAGSTWSPFYVGRIDALELDDPLWFSLTVREPTDELQWQCFVSRPSNEARGVAMTSLIPAGISGSYGFDYVDSVDALTGTFRYTLAEATVTLDAESLTNPANIYTSTVEALMGNVRHEGPWYRLDSNAAFDPTKASNYVADITSGSVRGRFALSTLHIRPYDSIDKKRVMMVDVKELPSDDPDYTAVRSFTFDGAVSIRIVPAAQAIDDNNPVFISRTKAVHVMEDVVQGRYGYLSNGVPVKGTAVNTSAVAALATGSFITPRFKVSKKMKVSEFLEKYIHPLGLGYRVSPVASGSTIIGEVVPFDNRLPTSVTGLGTIGNADIADVTKCGWEMGKPITTITLKYYQETIPNPIDLSFNSEPWSIEETEKTVQVLLADNVDANGEDLTIDALGIRSPKDQQFRLYAPALWGGAQSKRPTTNTDLDNTVAFYTERFGNGAATAVLSCRRTNTVSALDIGMWTLVDVDVLPDPNTNLRGGTRVMQVTERSEQGLNVTLRLMDGGLNVVTDAPTFGTVIASGSASSSIVVPVSTAVNQRLQIDLAETSTGTSSRPVVSSSLWETGQFIYTTPSGSHDYVIGGLPGHTRIYLRARTIAKDGKLSSDWTFPTPGYFDTPALTAPTSLTFNNLTATSAHVSWSNAGDTGSVVHVFHASPSTATATLYAMLPAGSTRLTMNSLSSASVDNPHKVSVLHVDQAGGTSASASVAFTLSGSAPTCDSMVGIKFNSSGVYYT